MNNFIDRIVYGKWPNLFIFFLGVICLFTLIYDFFAGNPPKLIVYYFALVGNLRFLFDCLRFFVFPNTKVLSVYIPLDRVHEARYKLNKVEEYYENHH